jgi:hypothetical protein
MYSPIVTKAMVRAASTKQGWKLQYHTRQQIDAAIGHFEELVHDETGQLKRPLNKDEVRWIQNERKLCALDFRYWTHYAWIIDWHKNPVHPTLNVAQNIVMDVWAEHEERAIAIIIMWLKARQLGITTVYQLATAHRFQFWQNSNVIIASADPKKTVEMGQMIRFCMENQPWWLIPSSPNDKIEKGMTVEFAAINARISIQAGNQFHGVARGGTPNVGHLTEVSSWNNAEEDIDASFIRAVHETPDVFVGLESTGKGQDGWFPDTWNIIKEDWPRGRSRIRGEFLPWFVGTDIYPPAADLRARPIPPDWIPADRTIAHAERARAYVLASPLLFKHLAAGNRDWQMPREQMWYYEIERDTALRKKTLNKFLEEMPADDNEAFQNTGISVIDQDVVLSYREKVRHPLGVYAIVGPGIHQSLIPPRSQWWTGKTAPPIINVPVSGVTRSTEIYQFVPLKFEGYPGYDPNFKLFIYEWPEDNQIYGLGVDTSDGIGQDWSAIEGLRIGSLERNHGQVCEYASPYIKADQLWPMALAIGAFYSTYHDRLGRRKQSRICVECRGNGEIVQYELKKRGWVDFHPWKKYDNRQRTPDGRVAKEGVFTNVWFRSMMMDKFLTVIDEQSLDLPSYWLVKELGTLERDPDEKSARAAYNTHDDRIMGICFPLFSLTVDLRPRQLYRRSQAQSYLPEAYDENAQNSGFATWQPSLQASSTLMRGNHPVMRSPAGRLTLGSFRPRSAGGW